MNIKTENTGNHQMGVIIEIEPADYTPQVDKAIRSFQQKANVPGFRQGHIPAGLVKKMHGPAIKAEEVNKIITDELHKYLVDSKLEILGEPILNQEKTVSDIEIENSSLSFYFDLGLQPDFEINTAKLPKITEYKIEASDKDIEKEILYMTRRFGKFEEPEICEETDLLYGDCVFSEVAEGENNNPFESTLFLDAIDDKKISKEFVGKKIGDVVSFDLKKAFKEDEQIAKVLKIKKEEVKDSKTAIIFTISKISRVIAAELNEELFEKVFPNQEVKTLEDFKSRIKEMSGAEYVQTSKSHFMNEAIKSLIDVVQIEIPDEFMKKWLVYSNKDLTIESVEAEYPKFRDSIKWQLIENKLVKDYSIVVSRDNIKNHIKDFFKNNYFQNSVEEDLDERLNTLADSALKNEKDVKNIYDQLFDNKINEALKQIFKVEQKNILAEEFVEMVSKNK